MYISIKLIIKTCHTYVFSSFFFHQSFLHPSTGYPVPPVGCMV